MWHKGRHYLFWIMKKIVPVMTQRWRDSHTVPVHRPLTRCDMPPQTEATLFISIWSPCLYTERKCDDLVHTIVCTPFPLLLHEQTEPLAEETAPFLFVQLKFPPKLKFKLKSCPVCPFKWDLLDVLSFQKNTRNLWFKHSPCDVMKLITCAPQRPRWSPERPVLHR